MGAPAAADGGPAPHGAVEDGGDHVTVRPTGVPGEEGHRGHVGREAGQGVDLEQLRPAGRVAAKVDAGEVAASHGRVGPQRQAAQLALEPRIVEGRNGGPPTPADVARFSS
jgi:hypothetical protein